MRPSDKQMLLDGFEHLSPDSRYARFMAPKVNLSETELRYLTEVDGVDHFAMGAIRRHLVSKDEGVGSARFVRLSDAPDTAEPAVTVLDDFQGKGLGAILLQRLIEAAWERDVRWFRTELLAENTHCDAARPGARPNTYRPGLLRRDPHPQALVVRRAS
jgi:GNAT superfamily N-acetyltransferase